MPIRRVDAGFNCECRKRLSPHLHSFMYSLSPAFFPPPVWKDLMFGSGLWFVCRYSAPDLRRGDRSWSAAARRAEARARPPPNLAPWAAGTRPHAATSIVTRVQDDPEER